MGYKYFIIGNAASVWMKEYIKEIHVKNDDKVYLTVFDESKMNFKEEYINMGVDLVVLGNSSTKVEKIKKLIRLLNFAIKHRKKDSFDIIEIQSPPHNFQAKIIAYVIQILQAKAFLMFWGSDILTINSKEARALECIVKRIDVINRPGQQAYNKFISLFGNQYQSLFTTQSLRFGTLALPWIEHIYKQLDVTECKQKIKIPLDRTSIAIGYNGKRRQQHMQVVEALGALPKALKAKFHLILHFVGCENPVYENEVKMAMDKCGLEYTFINGSLDFENIAILRVATDIFIHAQTTDGLSGSIRECLYADTIVINPSWIQYDELKKLDVDYLEYKDFSELKDIVADCLANNISVDIKKNQKIIYDNYSWDAVAKDWIKVFRSML